MISVIIATYNRGNALRSCLAHFEKIEPPPAMEWELIIVDNRSTDSTPEIVRRHISSGRVKTRYVYEARAGKSYALNSGLAAAKGEIIAFTDDDCFVNPDWLVRLAEDFGADASLSALGGRVELFDNGDADLSVVRHPEAFTVTRFDQVWSFIGCNMAIRRAAFDRIGGFDVTYSPGTKRGAVVEDIDLIYRIYKAGLKAAYSPHLLVYHNHGRRTEEDVARVWRAYMIGRGAFYCKHAISGDREMAGNAYWDIRSRVKKILQGRIFEPEARRRCRLLAAILTGGAYECKMRLLGKRS